jgi:hypothetical protein
MYTNPKRIIIGLSVLICGLSLNAQKNTGALIAERYQLTDTTGMEIYVKNYDKAQAILVFIDSSYYWEFLYPGNYASYSVGKFIKEFDHAGSELYKLTSDPNLSEGLKDQLRAYQPKLNHYTEPDRFIPALYMNIHTDSIFYMQWEDPFDSQSLEFVYFRKLNLDHSSDPELLIFKKE